MRALVLSGGGAHGGYEVGAIKYLMGDLGNQYQTFTGVSVGAINAAFLAQYPVADQKQAAADLYALWASLKDSDVKNNWFPLGIVHALWLDSAYNSNALWSLVRNKVSLAKIRASGNKVAVSATCVNTGDYRTFTQDDDDFIDGVLASCSYPMGLKPIVIDGQKYTDGGVRHVTPISEAVKFGPTELDIIICGPVQTSAAFSDVDAITYGLRCFSIMQDQMQMSDLKILALYNRLIAAGLEHDKQMLDIKMIRPASDLAGSSLTFDQSVIAPLLTQGYNEAKIQYK